jgi:tRNA(Arg) A34 adenosine deaminase TadA
MTKNGQRFMDMALQAAYKGMANGEGGPFGACIVHKGRVLGVGHNRVLRSRNPTQHAEICAIGLASKKLGSHELKDCEIYSTTEPCPMCFSAIHWAKIPKVYFGTTVDDVRRLGFNELTISNVTMKKLGGAKLKLFPGFHREACEELLRSWRRLPNKKTY